MKIENNFGLLTFKLDTINELDIIQLLRIGFDVVSYKPKLYSHINDYKTSDYYKYFTRLEDEYLNNINRNMVKNTISMVKGVGEDVGKESLQYLFPKIIICDTVLIINKEKLEDLYNINKRTKRLKEFRINKLLVKLYKKYKKELI
ncbi:hypothetical protein QUF55_09810 [Clostridiaceae bacterium HSG29]|nr:hypothetical protein [Clostridiaceae bacterium HSG29]